MSASPTRPSEFDYVIVGAGSAGCVLAARLSEDPGVSVALLEAGPPDTSVLIHCPAGLALLAKNGQANWALQTVPQAGQRGHGGRVGRHRRWQACKPGQIACHRMPDLGQGSAGPGTQDFSLDAK